MIKNSYCKKLFWDKRVNKNIIATGTNSKIPFNSNSEIEPASMTKIMTVYVTADQISNDLISIDDEVLISEKAWRMEGSKNVC